MNKKPLNILLPMAGGGQRFIDCGYKDPKPLIDVNGKPMIKAVLDSINLEGRYIFVVRQYESEENNNNLLKVLHSSVQNSFIFLTPKLTRGAAETCLLAKDLIDNETPLIITNCDQIFNFNLKKFTSYAKKNNADGLVAVFNSADSKYSYIKTDNNGVGIRLAEKEPISNFALTGLHYWKHGADFVRSAEKMISLNDQHKNEFYIAPVYNYLIKESKLILPFITNQSDTKIIGTPEELEKYLENGK